MSLYRKNILDHYRNPRNTKPLSSPDQTVTVINSTCGDKLTVQVCFEGSTIGILSFSGTGCILSQAAASILIDSSVGKTRAQIQALNTRDIQTLLGVQLGPNRLQCAYLPLKALKTLIQKRNHD
jgi:nitrogen fixation protein NifU and related proteins